MLQKPGLVAATTKSISDKYDNLRDELLVSMRESPHLNDYLLLLNSMQAVECVQAVCRSDDLASIILVHLSYKIMAEAVGRVQMEFFNMEPHKALRDLVFARMAGGGEGNWYQRLPFAHETNLFNLISKWGSERAYILTDVSELNAELLKIVTPICPRIQTPAALQFDASHMKLSDEDCRHYAAQFIQTSRTSTPELRHLQYILLTIEIAKKVFVSSDLFGQSLCQQTLAAALMVFINNNMKKLEGLNFNDLSMQYPIFRTARNDFAHAICLEDIVGNPAYTWQQYLLPCLNDFKSAVQSQLEDLMPEVNPLDTSENKHSDEVASTTEASVPCVRVHISTSDATPMSPPAAHKPKKKKANKANVKLQNLIEIIETSEFSNHSFKEKVLASFQSKSARINNEVVMYLLQACVSHNELALLDNLLDNLHHIIAGSVVNMINMPIKAKFMKISVQNIPLLNSIELPLAATYSLHFLEKSSVEMFEWEYVFALRKKTKLPSFINMYLLAVFMMLGNDASARTLCTKLIKMGANPNVSTLSDSGRVQPILNCALMRGLEFAETLLVGGGNPNYPDQIGKSPFIFACELGMVDNARLLLHYKADIYSRTTIGIITSNLLGHIYFHCSVDDGAAKTFISLIIQEAVRTKGYAALAHLLQCKTELRSSSGYRNSGPFTVVMTDIGKFPQDRTQTLSLLKTVAAVLHDQSLTLHKLLLLDSIPVLSHYFSAMTNRDAIGIFKIQVRGMDVFKFSAIYNSNLLSSAHNGIVWGFLQLELSKRIILETPSSQIYPVDLGKFPTPLTDANRFFINISSYIGHQLHVVSPHNNTACIDVAIEAIFQYLFEDIYMRAMSVIYDRLVIPQVKKVMPGILFQLASSAWPKSPDKNMLAIFQVQALSEDVNIIAEYLGMGSFVERLLNERGAEQGAIKD